jgi:hypothetical protein
MKLTEREKLTKSFRVISGVSWLNMADVLGDCPHHQDLMMGIEMAAETPVIFNQLTLEDFITYRLLLPPSPPPSELKAEPLETLTPFIFS